MEFYSEVFFAFCIKDVLMVSRLRVKMNKSRLTGLNSSLHRMHMLARLSGCSIEWFLFDT